MDTATIIMFAIQSALKLGAQARQAYIDSTIGAALALPLPNFATNFTVEQAHARLADMKPETWPPGTAPLMQKIKAGLLTGGEQQRLMLLALEVQLTDPDTFKTIQPLTDGTFLTSASINAMVQIRQWSSDDNPNPSAVQRVAGTLFQIGVDYFANVPGALNTNSSQGKIVNALLTSIDSVDFATVDLRTKSALQDLPVRLLTATIDTITAHPSLISGNAHTQLLVQTTAQALTTNVRDRIAASRKAGAPDMTAEANVIGWADVVYRSVLQGAGTAVAKDPATFLGIRNPGEAALVSDVSQAALSFVLEGHPGQSATAIGRAALDTVVQAALTSVAQHPELLARAGNGALQALLVDTAKALSTYSTLLTPAIVPAVTEIILAGTLKNLEMIWPNGSRDPADHLLLTAATMTLKVLTTTDPADTWRPGFTADDATSVVQTVVNELLANPGWLVDRAGKLDPALGDVLSAVFATLRSRADRRLSPATAQVILGAALKAVAARQAFVGKLQPSGQLKLAAAIDAVLGVVFDRIRTADQAWPLVRATVVETLVEQGLQALSGTDLADARFASFRQALANEASAIGNGGLWDPNTFAQNLKAALA
jgi:hypothetical protein